MKLFFTQGDSAAFDRLTRFSAVGENAPMADVAPSIPIPNPPSGDLPDRLCTWCRVSMKKRLVGGMQFVHYTCPKCVFQHTTRLGQKPPSPAH